jgi:deoxyribodipyrimidine photolyase-related protein
VREKTGPDACPLDYLYWDFIARNRHVFDQNRRMTQTCQAYDALPEKTKADIALSAHAFLDAMDAASAASNY